MGHNILQKFVEETQVDHMTPTNLTAAATLTVYQTKVVCDSTDGAFAVTLPNVGEAVGKFFSIVMSVDNGDVTIQDQDESLYFDGDYTLNDVGDGYLLYSDGMSWWAIGALS